jgi:uncharacterized protein YggE
MDRIRTVLLGIAIGVVALLLGIALGRSRHESSGATPRAITVNGTATVSSVPHEAQFTLGVTATAKTATAATSANASEMTRVIAVFKANGVAPKDIQTAQISLAPNTNDAGTKVINYTVTNNVTVNIRDLTKAGSIIDAAVNAGANQVSGPTLTPTGQQEIYATALAAAITNARSRAQAIAQAAGEKLGKLRAATETSTTPPIAFSSAKAATPGVASTTPVEPGVVQTEADVTATYDVG